MNFRTFTAMFLAATAISNAEETESQRIDARLQELATIWKQDQAVINGFTRNRTQAVKEGTKEYYACLESSKRIKQAEEEAATLKAKKAQIESSRVDKTSESTPQNGDDDVTRQMKAIIAKVEAGQMDYAVADARLRQLAEQKAHRYILGIPEPSSTGPATKSPEVKESLADLATTKSNLETNHAKLLGFWRSVKKDSDDEFIYSAFSETEKWHILTWTPYRILREEKDDLIYSWVQDTGSLGTFDHTTKVSILPDGKIKILEDKISEGILYEKIPEDQWIKEQDALDEAALQELRGKMQGLIKQVEYR